LTLGELKPSDAEWVYLTNDQRSDLREQGDRPKRQHLAAEALLRGEVDAIYAKGAVGATLIAEHGLRPIIDINADPDPFVRVNAGTPRPITVDRELAIERPELVARYLAVLLRTAQWAAQHPAEVVAAVAAETGAREQEVRRGFGDALHLHFEPTLSEQSVAGLAAQKQFLLEQGFLAEDFDYDAWIVREPLALAQQIVHDIEQPKAA
jgi:sulfonate transport system substrate-binding protein